MYLRTSLTLADREGSLGDIKTRVGSNNSLLRPRPSDSASPQPRGQHLLSYCLRPRLYEQKKIDRVTRKKRARKVMRRRSREDRSGCQSIILFDKRVAEDGPSIEVRGHMQLAIRHY
jgi:hypothetical protein